MNQQIVPAITRSVGQGPSRGDILRCLTRARLGLMPRISGVASAMHRRHKRGKKDKHKHKTQQPTSPPSPSPPSPPTPETRADATCSGAVVAAGSSPDGNARIAQTFSALTSGLLVSVE